MMSEADVSMLSLKWWVSVFFSGLFIHIVASYLKPVLDLMGGRLSRTWAERNAKRAEVRVARIAELRSSEKARWAASFKEISNGLTAIQFLALSLILTLAFLGIAVLVFNKTFPHPTLLLVFMILCSLVGSVASFLSIDAMLTATKIRIELRDVEKLEEQQKSSPHALEEINK
jgi:hypothetical protein